MSYSCPALQQLARFQAERAVTMLCGAQRGGALEADQHMHQHGLAPPFVEVQWEMLHHNPSIVYFKSLSINIQVARIPTKEKSQACIVASHCVA